MSDTLTRDLRDVANREHAAFMKQAMTDYNGAITAIRTANNPDSAAVDLIHTSEELARHAKAFAEKMRDKLSAEMRETGQFEVLGTGIAATMRSGSLKGYVTDSRELEGAYPELYLPQPDKLDQGRLTKMLRAGMKVPGAELSAGAPSLAIRRI